MRETLKRLIDSGVILAGTEIQMKDSSGDIIEAVILQTGKIRFHSGEIFSSPSSAARFLRKGVSANGWRTWRFKANSQQIGDYRLINSNASD